MDYCKAAIKKSQCLLTVLLFLSNSCSDKNQSDPQNAVNNKHLLISTTEVNFGSNDNLVAQVPVAAQDCGWRITGNQSWLNVSPNSGNSNATVIMTATENKSVDESRLCILLAESTDAGFDYSKNIKVSQSHATVEIQPSESSLSFSASSSMKTIAIKSNVEWNATSSDSWIKVNRSGSNLDLTIAENAGASRQGHVYLTRVGYDDVIAIIQVVQGDAGVTGSQEELEFSTIGETKTVSFSSDAAWTADVSDSSWITVSPNSGESGSRQIKITALPNLSTAERRGFVYLKIGLITKLEIPLHQNCVEITPSESSISFEAAASTKSITVHSNVEWEIKGIPEWLTVTPQKGKAGDTELKLSVTKNDDSIPRQCQLTIAMNNGVNLCSYVNIVQDGVHYSEIPNTMEFPSCASSQYIDIDTEADWTAYTDSGEWIHLSPTVGHGKGSLTISVDQNNDLAERQRTGNVGVVIDGQRYGILVVQMSNYFAIDCYDVIPSAMPCRVSITLSTNDDWSVASDVNWLVPSVTTGNGDTTFTVDVGFNPSGNYRIGNLVFTAYDNDRIVLSFKQPGRRLSVNAESIIMSRKGGESQIIKVSSDGDFNVYTDCPEWIGINRNDSENTFSLTVKAITEALKSREGTVVIELAGIPEGETPVRRVVKISQDGNNFILDGYGDDENVGH